jgi:hypothetical protein
MCVLSAHTISNCVGFQRESPVTKECASHDFIGTNRSQKQCTAKEILQETMQK